MLSDRHNLFFTHVLKPLGTFIDLSLSGTEQFPLNCNVTTRSTIQVWMPCTRLFASPADRRIWTINHWTEFKNDGSSIGQAGSGELEGVVGDSDWPLLCSSNKGHDCIKRAEGPKMDIELKDWQRDTR